MPSIKLHYIRAIIMIAIAVVGSIVSCNLRIFFNYWDAWMNSLKGTLLKPKVNMLEEQ